MTGHAGADQRPPTLTRILKMMKKLFKKCSRLLARACCIFLRWSNSTRECVFHAQCTRNKNFGVVFKKVSWYSYSLDYKKHLETLDFKIKPLHYQKWSCKQNVYAHKISNFKKKKNKELKPQYGTVAWSHVIL